MDVENFTELSCAQCAEGAACAIDFSFAFQPIVDYDRREVVAYEALVRGPAGEGAAGILAQVGDDNRYRFDQACRVRAVKLAAELGIPCRLNINFLPNAVYRPELCIRTTLAAAEAYGFPVERIVFEIIEGEQITDREHLVAIVDTYKRLGFRTAFDDFGAGYAGLNLLAEYQPDQLKLDMQLIRDIHRDPVRQAIVEGIMLVCERVGIEVLAEGVESRHEIRFLRGTGIKLFQGYYFARPGFECLPEVAQATFDL